MGSVSHVRTRWRHFVAVVIAALLGLTVLSGFTSADMTGRTSINLSSANSAAVAPSRPRYVAGYTLHARLRMSERDVSSAEVETLVRFGPNGRYQGDDTWLIVEAENPLRVVINRNAYIVTVYV